MMFKDPDIKYFYEERAAIYEFDAGYSRQEAEHKAYIDTIVEYQRRKDVGILTS